MSSVWPLTRLQVELVNVCNYRCPLCRTLVKDGVKRRRMELAEFAGLLKSGVEEIRWLALYGTRGEPLLHPQLEQAVALAARATEAKVVISTNGSLVTRQRACGLLDAGLSELIFAIDGLTQASYQQYRVGGKLEKVLEHVRGCCDAKRRGNYATHIVLQFIPMRSNEHEVPCLEEFGRELGVDEVRLKLSSSVTASDTLRPTNESYQPSRVHTREQGFDCPSGLDYLYVDPNGDCFPCCYGEGYGDMCVGNAFASGLESIWESPKLWALRRSFAEQRGFRSFCLSTCHDVARRERVTLYKLGIEPRV